MKTNDNKVGLTEIYDTLRNNGFRITSQREYILDVFLKNKQGLHLSVEDLRRILKTQHNLSVSTATVYRTVKQLHELGILREVDLAEDHKHYELVQGDKEHHHHIVCLNCGHTIEFESMEINTLAREIADRHGVESIRDIELRIVANCKTDDHQHTDNEFFSANHRQ